MLLVFRLKDFIASYISFLSQVKNNVIHGYFTRILYSDPLVSTKGIYLDVSILQSNGLVEDDHKKETPHNADNSPNITTDFLHQIIQIEKDILEKYQCSKSPKYVLQERIIEQRCFKANINKHVKLILKISGVWETDTSYGLAYKFITF